MIDATPGKSEFSLCEALQELGQTHRRRAILFVMSDFLSGLNADQEPDWAKPLRMLSQRHEVVALQFTDPFEFELPKAGLIKIHDPASGNHFMVDSNSKRVRTRYHHQALREQSIIEHAISKARVDRVELSTERGFVDDLFAYFHRREMRTR